VGSSPLHRSSSMLCPAMTTDLIIGKDTENGKDPITKAPHLKELTDENVLINQLEFCKDTNFKERLTQIAAKLRRMKIDDPAADGNA
ncbi:hypothetical protein CDAR_530451, partial [Caerostris darwini]